MMDNSNYRILIVDDEQDILEFIEYNLIKEGYQVDRAENGLQALEVMEGNPPNLVLLDVMMPQMDGFEVCKTIRKNPKYNDVLISFLTARREDLAQISGLDAGADDYISKPIKPKVLMSRIAALLRRLPNETAKVLDFDRLKIYPDKHVLTLDGEELTLPKKEYDLLLLLASKPGKVFTREKIYSKVWGADLIVGVRTIDVHIRKIREKIGDDYITTIKGIGYKFNN